MLVSKKMKYFMMVANERSFKVAAEKLFLSATPVSKAVHDLEDFLGYKLLVRTPKGVELTEKGRILFNSLEPINKELNKIEKSSLISNYDSIKIITDGFYFDNSIKLIEAISESHAKNIYISTAKQFDAIRKFNNDECEILNLNSIDPALHISNTQCIYQYTDEVKLVISINNLELYKSTGRIIESLPMVQNASMSNHSYTQISNEQLSLDGYKTRMLILPDMSDVIDSISSSQGYGFIPSSMKAKFDCNKIAFVTSPLICKYVYRKFFVKKERAKKILKKEYLIT